MIPTPRTILAAALLVAALPGQKPTVPTDGAEVHTSRSGLKYSVLQAGPPGARPGVGDRVRFHYSAWLTDGTLVETTRLRAKPLRMTLGVAMPRAWEEGLQLLTAGSRCKLTAPPHLAYDSTGTPGQPPEVPPVPPDATVIFEVELIDFEKGVALPAFAIPDPKRLKTTASGLRFETLRTADGRRPTEGERFTVEFTMFNARGQLVSTSLAPEIDRIVGRVGSPLPGPKFLPEAIGMLRLGEKVRFVVPAALAWGKAGNGYLVPPDTETIWELELVKVDPAPQPRPVPEFRRLERGKVRYTGSGLRYEVVEPGSGRKPGPRDAVEIHFVGWSGTKKQFVETFRKGIPALVDLGRPGPDLTKGLAEGLQLMSVGAVYRLVVPPALGYGLRGRKDLSIGPNSRLYYHVEVVRVVAGSR